VNRTDLDEEGGVFLEAFLVLFSVKSHHEKERREHYSLSIKSTIDMRKAVPK